ncbi:fibrinogen-like YCDxxxxGGGW domain-containing protein [Aeromicrobium sp. CF3.5]|uniref:fibrinogen-like YCDxxxxGGGW domain-containing protein n=1 Tax=Aeromicrobium sp. CF3.5 TaxID=3373078 RepID=UPI003EE54ADA
MIRLRPLLLASLVAVPLSLLVAPGAGAAPPVTGRTQDAAAASCWEIKQNNPSSSDGTYWLQTPQLVAPQKFYCDMTTDGGGWVLIARGREGWQEIHNGVGTPEDVSGAVTGRAAFAPRQLDAHVIDALVGGRRFDSMTDGVRLRRAANATGTQWQESRLKLTKRDRWSWALAAGFAASGSVGGVSFSGTTTRDIAIDNGARRIWTFDSATNGYVRGFNYGSAVKGSTDPNTYLYSKATGGTHATPFTQMFIRPRLQTSDLTYAAIPDAGTPAQVAAPIPQNGSAPTRWGVSGTGAAGTGENATEVQAFAQIGNVMYVGGNFTTVQKGATATGSDKISRPYLAAFDATTGDYLSSFRPPALNNQVKALVALPGGKLAVGGEFTTVGTSKRQGLVVLNGATGAVDTAWTASLVNNLSGLKVSVRALDVGGDYLYVGGSMTHFQHGSKQVYAKGAGRIKISTRAPDTVWNPEFNGTVTGLDVSSDVSRVYFSGYFTQARGVEALRGAAFGTAGGAPRITPTWTPTVSTTGSSRYQQAVKEVGSRVWLGGAQHNLFGYDRSTFALKKAHITRSGGDVQAIEAGNGLVFQGNHSEHFNYSDTTTWEGSNPGNPNPVWSQADRMNFLGAYDAGTGNYAADFSPKFRARGGMGVWAIKVASNGAVWAGGSLTSSISTSGANQWVGGFTRFEPRPHTAPSQPAQATATLTDTTATISWTKASTPGVSYEVLRGDRVVATTTDTSVVLPGSAASDRWFVRASDGSGNRSPSTSVFSATAQAETEILLGSGATWSYLFDDSVAVPSTWQRPSFVPTGWKSGAAPLGFGSSDVATDIDVPAGERRAVVSYYRSTFDIAPGQSVGTVTVTTRADDAVAAYVNGIEVGRSNLDDGTLSASSYAKTAPRTSRAAAEPVTFEVPLSALRQGVNTVAISVHSMYRATPDSSMDATVEATEGSNVPDAVAGRTALVAQGSAWSYLFSRDTAAPTTWKTSASGTDGWRSGAAPLGFGTGPITTDIDVPTGEQRGLASYFRRTFTVADPGDFSALTLTTRADDGVVVYVNGTEVSRVRMPTGTITANSYATSAVSTAQAVGDPVVLDLPATLLKAGTNTIAVEVHSNYRSTANTSMDLSLIGTS